MRFSNEWFYGGAMTAAPEVGHRGILDYDTPIEWIDTANADLPMEQTASQPSDNESASPSTDLVGRKSSCVRSLEHLFQETEIGNSHGKINRDEAEFAVRTLRRYIEKIGKQRFLDERIDIGLISPYRAQVQYLRGLIKRTPFFKPFRHLISVNTVDGFQGQERDVIMISLVRSNEEGNIGFLRDLRRMNVAMTRARMKLIIIGDVATLTHNPFYRHLHDSVSRIDIQTLCENS